MTIEEIQNRLREGELLNNPHEVAEIKAWLSGEYSFIQARLSEIEARRGAIWMTMRQGCKTDKETDRKYEMSQDGHDWIILRGQSRGIEKMLSSLSSLLRIAEGESRNLH